MATDLDSRLLTLPPEFRLQIAVELAGRPRLADAAHANSLREYMKHLRQDAERASRVPDFAQLLG